MENGLDVMQSVCELFDYTPCRHQAISIKKYDTSTFIENLPKQVIPFADKVYPLRHEQVNDPGLLWQLWSHLPSVHSLISENIVRIKAIFAQSIRVHDKGN